MTTLGKSSEVSGRFRVMFGALAAVVLGVSCGGSEPEGAADSTVASSVVRSTTTTTIELGDPGGGLAGAITVFADAALTAAFTEIAPAFEANYPGSAVILNFDTSTSFVAAIIDGANADLFASADASFAEKLVQPGLVTGEPVEFAVDKLQIILPPDNPAAITGLTDLGKRKVKVVLCDPGRPCGKIARKFLKDAPLPLTPVSLEQTGVDVVAKVAAGQGHAGIVFGSVVAEAGDVITTLEIPADLNMSARFPIVALKGSRRRDLNAAFIEFLTGPEGQAIMAKHGFDKP